MYNRFAEVYDRLMDDFDYPAWAEYYLGLLKKAGCTPKTMCECGCGTGSMTLEFARRGLKITGVDLSGEMLAEAQKKARAAGLMVPFVQEDMTALTLPRRVDAIVACCDGVNYLTDMDQVKAFFRAARQWLKPGGALAFDVSTERKLLEQMGDAFFGEDRDEVTYLWQNRREGQLVRMELTFFLRREDGLYERFDEEQVQRAHTIPELTGALVECGFSQASVFGGQTFDAPSAGDLRVHIVARAD